MDSNFRNPKTLNQFDVSLMKSGIQKYIRRGETEKALYCLNFHKAIILNL